MIFIVRYLQQRKEVKPFNEKIKMNKAINISPIPVSQGLILGLLWAHENN